MLKVTINEGNPKPDQKTIKGNPKPDQKTIKGNPKPDQKTIKGNEIFIIRSRHGAEFTCLIAQSSAGMCKIYCFDKFNCKNYTLNRMKNGEEFRSKKEYTEDEIIFYSLEDSAGAQIIRTTCELIVNKIQE